MPVPSYRLRWDEALLVGTVRFNGRFFPLWPGVCLRSVFPAQEGSEASFRKGTVGIFCSHSFSHAYASRQVYRQGQVLKVHRTSRHTDRQAVMNGAPPSSSLGAGMLSIKLEFG